MSEEMKEEIKEKNSLKTCFVIMPISDVDGYDKGHFTRVYEHIIKPACVKAGFNPKRADDTSKANVIIVDILQEILKADVAICDISARNANVFFELGFRQAFNKKTVLIKDDKTIMPFDIYGIRTIFYKSSLRIDEVYKSITEIEKALIETDKAEAKDINSFISLLSVEKASLSSEHTLSLDASVILNSINGLKEKLAYQISNSTISYASLNKKVYANCNIGDTISYYKKTQKNGKYKNDVGIGKIIEELNADYYLVSDNKNGINELVHKNSIIRTL